MFNDFDTNASPRVYRCGPTAFLALDLTYRDQDRKVHIEPRRRYRHALESLFWISVWITSSYNDKVRTVTPDFQRRWLDHDIWMSGAARNAMLYFRVEDVPVTRSYQLLAAPIRMLKFYWMMYFYDQRRKMDHIWMSPEVLDPTVNESEMDTDTESAEEVERKLLALRAAFEDPKKAKNLGRMGLIPDIPMTLFPNCAKPQEGVGIE